MSTSAQMMMHANTDIATIMSQKTISGTNASLLARNRPQSGQRRFIPKPTVENARGISGFTPANASKAGGASMLDAQGAQLRKDLAMRKKKTLGRIDVREEA